MTGRIAQSLHTRAYRLKRHPNRVVRRAAQLAILVGLIVRLAPWRSDQTPDGAQELEPQLIGNPSFAMGVRDYLKAPGVLRPWLGLIARVLVWLEAANARARELARSDHRTFVLRVEGAIDQAVLRNLLIWQNHVLAASPGGADGPAVDVMLLLAEAAGPEARLFDLVSSALMLERIRNVSVFWDVAALASAAPYYLSAAERSRWSGRESAQDLRLLSREITDEVEQKGTSGGVRMLLDGRKRAQDFLKATLPGRSIVAVSLREDVEGGADPDDIDLWLPLLEAAAPGRPDVAFVILNRIAPSRWRRWPAHVRLARHQGLSLQDSICLAQCADGYTGVMDICGLAANAAGRPGVYVALADVAARNPWRDELDRGPAPPQIMVGGCDRDRIAAALERFLAALPRASTDALGAALSGPR
jgi:hypothetical protein